MRQPAILLLCALLLACEAPAGEAPQPASPHPEGEGATAVPPSAITVSLREFVAAPLGDLNAGSCIAPAEPGTHEGQMIVMAPERGGANTILVLTLDSAGAALRYSETRGVPMASAGADAAAAPPTSHMDFDLLAGHGVAVNRLVRGQQEIAQGRIADFEQAGLIGDVSARLDLVRRLCAAHAT